MANTNESLAANVPNWGVKTAYGESRTVDGVEIVPVAAVGFGFGEGGDENGTGSGGGGWSVPLGAYVGGADGLKFRPNLIALLAVSIPVLYVGGHALAKVVKALKR